MRHHGAIPTRVAYLLLPDPLSQNRTLFTSFHHSHAKYKSIQTWSLKFYLKNNEQAYIQCMYHVHMHMCVYENTSRPL